VLIVHYASKYFLLILLINNLTRNVVPSFIIIEFKEHSLTAFMYSLIEDEVKIDKIVLPL